MPYARIKCYDIGKRRTGHHLWYNPNTDNTFTTSNNLTKLNFSTHFVPYKQPRPFICGVERNLRI